jgi:hypothetical protein
VRADLLATVEHVLVRKQAGEIHLGVGRVHVHHLVDAAAVPALEAVLEYAMTSWLTVGIPPSIADRLAIPHTGGMVHAVLVRVTVKDDDAGRKMLTEEVVPRASAAPGFVAGYWTRSANDQSGVSMIVFDTEDQANMAKQMIEQGPPNPDAVTLESVEVREVIESA